MTRKEIEKFNFSNANYLILAEHKDYTRTASGKSWKASPDKIERIAMTAEQYTNFIQAANWFNSFFKTDFNGNRTSARCTIEQGYTMAGYLPTASTNINPDSTKKVVTRIEFVYKPDLMNCAGYREKTIINDLDTWTYDYCNGYMVYRFTAKNGNSCEYSEKLHRFTA